jgi:leader peptidase (prepilin peptidase)/N-methyltransferase
LIFLVAGLLGLMAGSFLNVVIHRVPRRQSVVWPASCCPACGETLGCRDKVPLLTYVMLRGRCRNCEARISARYPLVEALTGILFAAAAYEFALGLELLSALALVLALVALAATDLEHRLLPNTIVGPAALVGFTLSVLQSPQRWWVYPVSVLAVAGGLFTLALTYRGGMGMGDVKMGGMLGAFLGPYAALAVFLGAVLGAITGGLLMAVGRMRHRHALPFGVFMAVGGIVVLFAGSELWEIYLELARGG